MEILEAILCFLIGLFGDLLLAALFDGGLADIAEALGRTNRNRVLATIGYLLLGCLLGWVSVLVLSERILQPGPVRGLSLILSPVCSGVLMSLWGRHRRAHNHAITNLATWYGGAAFAFGISLVRFLLVK